MVDGERTGVAVSWFNFQACTMGAQPSAWMAAILGTRSINPICASSANPLTTPIGPIPPLTDWIYQSGARQSLDVPVSGLRSGGPVNEVNCSAISKAMVFIPSIAGTDRAPVSWTMPRCLANVAATCLV